MALIQTEITRKDLVEAGLEGWFVHYRDWDDPWYRPSTGVTDMGHYYQVFRILKPWESFRVNLMEFPGCCGIVVAHYLKVQTPEAATACSRFFEMYARLNRIRMFFYVDANEWVRPFLESDGWRCSEDVNYLNARYGDFGSRIRLWTKRYLINERMDDEGNIIPTTNPVVDDIDYSSFYERGRCTT